MKVALSLLEGGATSHYENLAVWRSAMDLAEAIYRVTASFPAVERFGLTSQSRRSALSVVSNIAEGRGGQSTKEFKRLIYGSLLELETS